MVWDRVKRIKQYRTASRLHPASLISRQICLPSRFNHAPECMYSSLPQELDFAIHVRLGDRTTYVNGFEADYMDKIQTFMDTVANAVTRRGFDSPRFHVFSETFYPCPQEESRTFREFPAWPVEEHQVPTRFPFVDAITPNRCRKSAAYALYSAVLYYITVP